MNAKDNRLRVRNAARDNLDVDYPACANTKGAPKAPVESKVGPGKSIHNSTRIVKTITDMLMEASERKGLAIANVSILTNHKLISLLAACDSMVVVDKTSAPIKLLKHYNQINAGVRRDQLPGNRLKHLVTNRFDDRGTIDGIRMMGVLFETVLKRINEIRPLMHRKTLVTLFPDKKTGIYKAEKAMEGGMNWSYNALSSFENATYTEDPDRAQFVYDSAAHVWSLSEGVYEIRKGVNVPFDWVKKAPKYKALPKCPDCGGNDFSPYWWQPKHESYAVRMLRCVDCNLVTSYP